METTASFTATASTAFFGLRTAFPDYLVPLRIMGPAGRIRPATLANLDALNDQWQSTVGPPAKYCAMGFNFMALTPQNVTDTTLSITYARSPAQMVGDSFPEIPEAYHPALSEFCVYRLRVKEGAQNLTRGVEALNRFLDEMTTLSDFVRAKSRAARYDSLPFELREWDRARLLQTIKGTKPPWQKA